jgi:hypothetical protein
MARHFNRVQTISRGGAASGYFVGCTAYSDGGQLSVVLRHRRGRRLRRPFPIVALDPPTIELDDPQNYHGFVPLVPLAA